MKLIKASSTGAFFQVYIWGVWQKYNFLIKIVSFPFICLKVLANILCGLNKDKRKLLINRIGTVIIN